MGRGDHASAEKTLGNCFVVQGVISVLLTAVLFTFQFRKAMRQLEESGPAPSKGAGGDCGFAGEGV